MSNYYGAPPSSPFYAQQQQPLHTGHGAPPPQHQQHQQPPYPATSPVSQSYSPSPPQQAPLRPHTAAPYAGSGFAPPSSAGATGYYPQFPTQQPPQQQQQQPSQTGYRPQQPQEQPSHYGSPQQPQQPRTAYPQPPPAPAPPVEYDIMRIANNHGLPPEIAQKLVEDLKIHMAPVQPVGPTPMLSHPVPQSGLGVVPPSAPGPPAPQQPMMQQQQQPPMVTIPGSFPSYTQAPAPQEPPQVPHHQYRQSQPPPGYAPQQQGYFPSQPIPENPASSTPPAPLPAEHPSPPPAPIHPHLQQRQGDVPHRSTSQRYRSNTASTHHSHTSTPATSTSSGPAGKPTKMEDGSIHYELWGDLVDHEQGREPMPKEKLVRLFREIAKYIIKERMPKESIVITPEKMVDFYVTNMVEGDDRMNWKGYFTHRTNSCLSSIYAVLGCEHFCVPMSRDQKPTIPALTPQGFETWMFTQLMTHPSREAARIQKVLASWPIPDTKEGRRFPKSIPRRCFPEKEDTVIRDGWWRVWEEFQSDFEDEEEDPTPLALPAPSSGNGSNGNRYYGPPPLQAPSPAADYPGAPPTTRRRTQQHYAPNPQDLNDDELDAIIKSGKDKPPSLERHRKPYASNTGNPGWKEELNPRPTLGEDKPSSTRSGHPPPSRPQTSHGYHPSRDAREFRDEPYVKPPSDRDPRESRDPRDPRIPRDPRDPRESREPREPRDSRDLRDTSDSAEGPVMRSRSTRRGHQRERSEYRRPSHRHSHSHHRGGGRRDRSPVDEPDLEWSGSSGVSAQTPTSIPDAGVPLDGLPRAPVPSAAPAPPPPEAHDRRGRAQRKADESARVAREQEQRIREFGNPGRYDPPVGSYDYDEFAPPPPLRDRPRERDDRRVAEYVYQEELERDLRAQPGGGTGGRDPGRRSNHHGGDRGRPRDRNSYWGP